MASNAPDDADAAFVQRYTANPQSVSNEEAVRRYQQVAAQLPPDDYRQAAEAALARLSPEERVALGRHLLTQAPAAGGANFPDVNGDGIDDRLQDPRYLAGVTAQVQQQPGLLERLLGGLGLAPGGSGPGGSQQQGGYQQGGYQQQGGYPQGGPPYGGAPGGAPLGGTLGKVALGGIAAAGLSRLLGGGRGGHGGGGFFGGGGGHHRGGHH